MKKRDIKFIYKIIFSYVASVTLLLITYPFVAYVYIPALSQFSLWLHVLPSGMAYFGGFPIFWYFCESILLFFILFFILSLFTNHHRS